MDVIEFPKPPSRPENILVARDGNKIVAMIVCCCDACDNSYGTAVSKVVTSGHS